MIFLSLFENHALINRSNLMVAPALANKKGDLFGW